MRATEGSQVPEMTATFQCSLVELFAGISRAMEPLDRGRRTRFSRAFVGRLWWEQRSLSGFSMAIERPFPAHLVGDLEVF